jgi:hypothetical protein
VSSPAIPWLWLLTLEILQLQALKSFLHSLQRRTQLITDWVTPTVFKITPRHRPQRKHGPSTVAEAFTALLHSNSCGADHTENTSFPTVTTLLHGHSLPQERVYRAIAQTQSLFTEFPLGNRSIRHRNRRGRVSK